MCHSFPGWQLAPIIRLSTLSKPYNMKFYPCLNLNPDRRSQWTIPILDEKLAEHFFVPQDEIENIIKILGQRGKFVVVLGSGSSCWSETLRFLVHRIKLRSEASCCSPQKSCGTVNISSTKSGKQMDRTASIRRPWRHRFTFKHTELMRKQWAGGIQSRR